MFGERPIAVGMMPSLIWVPAVLVATSCYLWLWPTVTLLATLCVLYVMAYRERARAAPSPLMNRVAATPCLPPSILTLLVDPYLDHIHNRIVLHISALSKAAINCQALEQREYAWFCACVLVCSGVHTCMLVLSQGVCVDAWMSECVYVNVCM